MRIVGGAELVNGVDFTVDLASGVLTAAARPATETLVIWRDSSLVQARNFSTAETPAGNEVEASLDGLTRMVQEADQDIKRTIRAPAGDELAELPDAATRKLTPFQGYDTATGAPRLYSAASAAGLLREDLNLLATTPGLVLDIDPRTGIVTDYGGTISAFEDADREISATITGTPKHKTDQAGRSFIALNGGRFEFPVSMALPFTAFAVVRVFDDSADNVLFDFPGRCQAWYRSTNQWAIQSSSDDAELASSTTAATRTGRATVVCFEFNGTEMRVWENDKLQIQTTALTGVDPTGNLFIGATSTNTATSKDLGIWRMLFYNRTLTADYRDQVISTLQTAHADPAPAEKIFEVSAEEGVTVGSSNVTAWKDVARNISATITDTPTLGTDAGGDKYIDLQAGRFEFTLNSPEVMTVIARVVVNNNSADEVILNTDDLASNERILEYRSTNAWALSVDEGAGVVVDEAGAATVAGSPTTVVAEFNGPASRVLERGVQVGGVLADLGYSTGTKIFLGDTDTNSSGSNIHIYRVAIFNGLLTESEREAILTSF